ncbi:MAG: hypothetical protein NZL99_07100 [Burkholderiaceae bacterium]|nr:hypothetical protein [Burkholderiaceae bacterium]MCX8114821.1 hypothetical protein [Burkholderiaceae bacterium]
MRARQHGTKPRYRGTCGAPPAEIRQLRRFESEVILRALEQSDGDRRIAAQRLGIGLSSLYRKLEELGIRDRARG